MLMFNYGIFATFIPELVMVIGFLLSIIVPNINAKQSAGTVNQQNIYVQSAEQKVLTSTYVVSSVDFQQIVLQDGVAKLFIYVPTLSSTLFGKEQVLAASDGLCFVQFSRPPPPPFLF